MNLTMTNVYLVNKNREEGKNIVGGDARWYHDRVRVDAERSERRIAPVVVPVGGQRNHAESIERPRLRNPSGVPRQ